MNNNKNYINIDKLQGSIESLSLLNDKIDATNLNKEFLEIEKKIKKIDFEHGNSFIKYKNDISLLEQKYEDVKSNLKKLQNSLQVTVEQFTSKEEKKNSFPIDLKSMSTKLTQIPKVETEPEVVEAQQQTSTINTIPIGLGIATAGIAGSVGAVVLDSMKGKKRDNLEEYHPTEIREKISDEQDNQKEELATSNFEDISPYHASRNSQEMNKFYGSNITEFYEDEDSSDDKFE